MAKRIGRPPKYKSIILALDDGELYTPALVAKTAIRMGLLRDDGDGIAIERQRCRIAMVRLTNAHFFPDEGDGMVTLKGQSPTPGWFGWRYKETLED